MSGLSALGSVLSVFVAPSSFYRVVVLAIVNSSLFHFAPLKRLTVGRYHLRDKGSPPRLTFPVRRPDRPRASGPNAAAPNRGRPYGLGAASTSHLARSQ